MSSAQRQRVYRQRQRRGEAVFRVALPDVVVLALIEAGRLTEAEAADRSAVEREVPAVLVQWAEAWLRRA